MERVAGEDSLIEPVFILFRICLKNPVFSVVNDWISRETTFETGSFRINSPLKIQYNVGLRDQKKIF